MNSLYLTEAFKELSLLEEETFNINSEDDVADFKELISAEDDTVDIIDDAAENEEELEDSYIGKVVLDCCVCHSKIYKDANDVIVDEEEDLANVGEECPYCYSVDGFKVIGQIEPFEEEAELKVEVEDKVEDETNTEEVEDELEEGCHDKKKGRENESLKEETVGQDVSEFQKWVDYDMEKYHKISNNTMNKIKKAGLSVVKDQYGDYEVIASRKDESLKNKSSKKLNERLYSLVPKHDSRASFYNKAKVQVDGNSETLISYDTPILKISNGKLEVLCDESALSATTMRHVKEFLMQAEEDGAIDLKGAKITRQWVASQANKGVKESLNKDAVKDKFNKKLSEAIKRTNGRKPLKESYADVFQDLVDRAESWMDDGDDKDEAVMHAIDDGLIYTRDIIDVAFHYGAIDDSELLNKCFEDLYSDLYAAVEDREPEEEFDESLKEESCKDGECKDGECKDEELKEGFEKVELETEDKVIKVSEEEKEEVPDAEMIAPLEDETKVEIDDNSIESEDDEDTFIDQDFDEFSEEDFDELGESYLKKVYGNVDSFKTSRVSTKGNTLKLEGVIKFNSGNKKNTTFLFEAKDINKKGKMRFIGENLQISRGKKSFAITGSIKENKLVVESFNYNYRTKDANGKPVRLYGTVRKQ